MSSAFKLFVMLLSIIILPRPSLADNGNKDHWLGKDKFQHFAVSAFYSGGIAVVANRHFDMQKDNSLILGASITISLGGAKEVYDHSRPQETSSVRDFIWDIGGVVVGGLLATFII
jgi:putative lipoprotein